MEHKFWLSILIPSINQQNLARFQNSLSVNSSGRFDDGIEYIINTQKVKKISEAFNECFARARGEWIWIANDDLISRTKNWDLYFKHATMKFEDKIAMFFPNDALFEETFACFPLFNRELAKSLFPMSYRRYKIDDSIMDIYPSERKIYIPEVIMEHTKVAKEGEAGFPTKSGKIYPIDYAVGKLDEIDYRYLAPKRAMIRENLCKLMKNECLLVS